MLGFCNARLGTEESNKAELPLDKDCLTLELEDRLLIDFRNGGLGTEDSAKLSWYWKGSECREHSQHFHHSHFRR